MKQKYQTIDDIPHHIFSNKECSETPSPALREYLRYMLDNHPDDLAYIWRYMQSFKPHGGCYTVTFEKWKTKLDKNLKAHGV